VLIISAGVGYVNYSVLIPNNDIVPPAVIANDVMYLRVATPNLSINYSTTGAILDGTTVNYIKIAYAEEDGLTRSRAKALGLYPFEKLPSYLVTVSPIAPTNYELCLGSVVTNGSTSTFGIINKDPIYSVMLDTGMVTIAPTPTAGTWTNSRSWAKAYQSNGEWRLKFLINGAIAPTTATLVMQIPGVTFKASSFIEDMGLVSTWTSQTAINHLNGACMPNQNSNQVRGSLPSNQGNWIFQGDFALQTKPTWVS
jgi:hypothetical protein